MLRSLPSRGATRSADLLAYAGIGVASLVFVAALVQWPSPAGAATGIALAAMVLCAAIDMATMRIPNALTYPGMAFLTAASATAGFDAFGETLAGLLLGGGLIGALVVVSRGAMGMGDVKLSALGGALVGPNYVLQALFAASLVAAVLCSILILTGRLDRRQPIAFGPHLALGFIATALLAGSILTRA